MYNLYLHKELSANYDAITKLEVFDNPRELKEFTWKKQYDMCILSHKITDAPQSWCYIEGE